MSISKADTRLEIERLGKYDDYLTFRNASFSSYSNVFRQFLVNTNITDDQLNELRSVYSDGYGLKTIAKELNMTYSTTRSLFQYVDLPIRKGMNVVTSKLKEFRSSKAKEERISESGWFAVNVRKELKIKNKTHKGVQGFYFNKSMNKNVWLRSTYEYIYAKWLDRTNHVWDSEVSSFTLTTGEKYRPDFFIFEEGKLSKIVEVKGYFDNRNNKASLLDSMLESVDVVLLNFTNSSIDPYIVSGSSYLKELAEWKKVRSTNENL